MAFLEETISAIHSFNSAVSREYEVEIVTTDNGNEYRRLVHEYQITRARLIFTNRTESFLYDNIVDLYQRSSGRFGGFRWKDPFDYSSNGLTGAATYNDQAAVAVSGGYQIIKWYGTEGDGTAGRRQIKKLTSGSVLVGIRDDANNPHELNVVRSPNSYLVDENTGLITFNNISAAITGITNAVNAVATFASHSFATGDHVHFSGVTGMTEINGLRGEVLSTTATTITTDIDSTGPFGVFTSSSPLGRCNTEPQANETVTAGFEFDIPMRFESDLNDIGFLTKNDTDNIVGVEINLVEILNP